MEIDLTCRQGKLLKKCNKKPVPYNKEYDPLIRAGFVCYTLYESDDIANWLPASNEIETTALGKEYIEKLNDKRRATFKKAVIAIITGIISTVVAAIITAIIIA